MMLRYFVILAATLVAAVLGQSTVTVSGASASATASGAAATHTIKVGFPVGQHAFSPENTRAEVGDTLVFEFLPKNHSVVLMDSLSPCIPFDLAGHPANELWWSGFWPVDRAEDPGIYTRVVENTDPMWFYCSAPESCTKYGMVGAINAKNPAADLASVQKAAKAAHFQLTPGESIPDEQNTGVTPTASTVPSSGGGDGDSGLSTGAIAGGAVGAVGAFALVGLLFFFVGRKKKAAELEKTDGSDAETAATAATAGAHGHGHGHEHPPMYQDPRYSTMQQPLSEQWGAAKVGHQSYEPVDHSFEAGNPNRMSELPSQGLDPVEIYTPGVQEQIQGTPRTPRTPGNVRN